MATKIIPTLSSDLFAWQPVGGAAEASDLPGMRERVPSALNVKSERTGKVVRFVLADVARNEDEVRAFLFQSADGTLTLTIFND
jgi:hypothetical protein